MVKGGTIILAGIKPSPEVKDKFNHARQARTVKSFYFATTYFPCTGMLGAAQIYNAGICLPVVQSAYPE